MQLLLKFLFNPAQVKHWSYVNVHVVQLIEHGMHWVPLSINPLTHSQVLFTVVQAILLVPLHDRQLSELFMHVAH